MSNSPLWPKALLVVPLPCTWIWRNIQSLSALTAPTFPAHRLLTPALGKPHSTLVAVFIFFLLTSLTFVLFKLSSRLVAKGHVFLNVCA